MGTLNTEILEGQDRIFVFREVFVLCGFFFYEGNKRKVLNRLGPLIWNLPAV